jgi:predicted signal transduction protein with EAL and GGDEF domain
MSGAVARRGMLPECRHALERRLAAAVSVAICATETAMAQLQTSSWDTDGRQAGDDSYARRAALERLERLAQLLDTAILIPGTRFRFGADAIIGLVPGIGDMITTAISAYIVIEARRLGAPRHLIARMIGNVALDGVIGAVPLVGDLFDTVWRANIRNMRLLRQHLESQGAV